MSHPGDSLRQKLKVSEMFKFESDLENCENSCLNIYRKSSFSEHFFEQTLAYQSSDHLTDFTIIVEGRRFRCHKIVLAASCPYFNAMFNCGMKENTTHEADLSDSTDAEVMKSIVKYFYTGDIEMKFDTMKSMVKTLDMLQLNGLKELAAEYISHRITPESCIGWYKFAELLRMQKVSQQAAKILHGKFAQVAISDEFLALDFTDVVDCISDRDIKMPNEDCLLNAAFHWAAYDEGKRKLQLRALLQHVQLENCSASALCDIVVRYKDFLREVDRELEQKIFEASIEALRQKHRHNQTILVVSGQSVARLSTSPRLFVEELFTIPIEKYLRYQPGFVTSDGFGLCGGGRSKHNLSSNLLFYHWKRQWTHVFLPTALRAPAVVNSKNKLHIFGGYDDDDAALASHYVFDLKKESWTSRIMPFCAEMPLAIKTSSKHVYIVSRAPLAPLMHIHNLKSGCWTEAAIVIPVKSAKHCCGTAVDSSIYLCGGVLESVVCYDTQMRSWSFFNRQPTPTVYAAAVAANGKIWVLGGECSDIQVYDVESNTWEVSALKLMDDSIYVSAFVECIDEEH